ncbi:surface localized decaheme cytochrome c lipo, MtrC domain protein, partial [Vibrio parahaemolyticus V-223/04]
PILILPTLLATTVLSLGMQINSTESSWRMASKATVLPTCLNGCRKKVQMQQCPAM